MKPSGLLAIAAALMTPAAFASVPRYQVNEIQAPPALRDGCLPGLVQSALGASINDLGIVSANFACYTEFVEEGPFPYAFQRYRGFIGASWLGSVPLRDSGVQSYAARINNLGQVFGSDSAPQPLGVRWSISGGFEPLFDAPECEGLNINGAQSGNARYVVGGGLRFAPELGSPYDTLCLVGRWLIRHPDGAVTAGPQNGSAYDINALDTAVGTAGESAIAMHVPSGETRVLRTGSPGIHGAIPADINDQGQVVGYSYTYQTTPDGSSCARNSALRWDSRGRETRLPHLPGAVSSRANSVGYSGEAVGDSGPGQHCPHTFDQYERAVLWQGTSVIDLNRTIPRHLGITLVSAASINRRGQILATGYENDDPLTVCPNPVFDPDTQEQTMQRLPCRLMRVYVLTPRN
jgi:hypothetical protein